MFPDSANFDNVSDNISTMSNPMHVQLIYPDLL